MSEIELYGFQVKITQMGTELKWFFFERCGRGLMTLFN